MGGGGGGGVRGTILEACWKASFAGQLIPKQGELRHDVVRYLDNNDHGHSGRRTRGRAPESAIGKAELWS